MTDSRHEMALAYLAAKRAVRDVFSDLGIDCDDDDMSQIILPHLVRNFLVKREYSRLLGSGMKKEAILSELSSHFSASRETIYSIIHARR